MQIQNNQITSNHYTKKNPSFSAKFNLAIEGKEMEPFFKKCWVSHLNNIVSGIGNDADTLELRVGKLKEGVDGENYTYYAQKNNVDANIGGVKFNKLLDNSGHTFNNPLVAIIEYLENLKLAVNPESRAELAKNIESKYTNIETKKGLISNFEKEILNNTTEKEALSKEIASSEKEIKDEKAILSLYTPKTSE